MMDCIINLISKRFLALLTAVSMAVGVSAFSTTAFADEEVGTEGGDEVYKIAFCLQLPFIDFYVPTRIGAMDGCCKRIWCRNRMDGT